MGAPQNRLFETAIHLQRYGVSVTVLTAMPNYPQMSIYDSYRDKNYVYEEINGIKVHRSAIYVSSNRGIISRLRNYFSFVISSYRVGKKCLEKQYDFLFCESPPLFLAYSAMALAKIKQASLVFNVSDLWPESAEKLGVVKNRFLLNMAYRLEAKAYKKSILVTGQTRGICDNIKARFPELDTYWLPNGADIEKFNLSQDKHHLWRKANGFETGDFLVLYAGIIGIAQGLEVILSAAEKVSQYTNIKFILLGSGPEKDRLLAHKNEHKLHNVYFLNPVSKEHMKSVLSEINAAVIPLKKLELFKGAIPSKIFENLAMKVPVILAVDGEAKALFIDEGKCALYSEPENDVMLAQQVVELYNNPTLCAELGEKGRLYVEEKFDRKKIAEKFFEKLKHIHESKQKHI